MKKYEYLANNDPIDNFKKIIEYYSKIKNIEKDTSENKEKEIIDNIDKSINEIINVYDIP